MLSKNNIQTGILLGLILPVLSVLLFEVIIHDKLWMIAHRGIPYFIVVALNLGVLRYFAAKKQERAAQGIMIVTFVFLIAAYFLRFR
jgi:hypothetical protein